MKRLIAYTGLCLLTVSSFAQQSAPVKKTPASPPATATATIAGKTITVEYSSPGVKGREGKIFAKDGLIGHDTQYPIWRAGANAATKLHTTANIRIGELEVPKGDYTLFVDISNPDNWVLIISKKTGEWGLAYDPTQDLGRVKMAMNKPSATVENLKYSITDTGNDMAVLMLAWEDHTASVPVLVLP